MHGPGGNKDPIMPLPLGIPTGRFPQNPLTDSYPPKDLLPLPNVAREYGSKFMEREG